MRSRRYTKRIEIYETTNVADGYGGNTVSEALLGESWCELKTIKNPKRFVDLGINDILNTIVINVKHRNDLTYNGVNQYLKYNGNKYIIKGITNLNLKDNDIEIIATKEI